MMREGVARYVKLKRSLGFQFRCQHILLRGFVAFAAKRGDGYVKAARVLERAALAPSPAQRRSRLLTVRRFALAMHAENARTRSRPGMLSEPTASGGDHPTSTAPRKSHG